ncbi:two-component system response regulator [Pseudaeromonas paramecii]|uniref:EAL domain-containing protein n=1 Tax=Pseudaeromonas paramecii TaxID=2138166 RepID=A0ABP8Q131_9GAMM
MSQVSPHQPPLILVVDDEASARLIMTATLEEAGFAVIEADSVASARAQFEQHGPDLVILDVILPDGNGIALCAELRQLPKGRSLPIAMATGLDDVPSIQQAFQSGATDFITKPISWGTLGHRVRYLLRAHHAFEELTRSEHKNRALLSALPDLLFSLDGQGVILERLAGAQSPHWGQWDLHAGDLLADRLPAPLLAQLQPALQQTLSSQHPQSLELTLPQSEAGVYWEVRLLPRNQQELLLVVRDISRRKRLEHELWLSARVFEASNEAILITDRENRIISVNPMFEQLTGFKAREVLGQSPRLLGAGQEHRSLYRNLWARLQEQGAWQGELQDRRKDGREYPVWLSINLLRDAGGQIEYHIASFADISERKRQEAQIAHLAFHDLLTGLPNRRLLTDRIQVAMAQAERDRNGLAVLLIDLDRFKTINDSLGHDSGDQLLKQVGERLLARVRHSDTVSRIGGDEFVVLSPECNEPATAAALATALLRALEEPFDLAGTPLIIRASIGIALYPDNGQRPDTLLANADAAMYQAKANDGNNYQFYSPELNERNLARLRMELRLRQALERQEFVLYFQPQVDAGSGRLVGAEALIRWQDPQLGLIPPGHFIPLAEETGLIQPIGDWVIQEVCRQQQRWRAQGLELPIAVNLSARQFRQSGFIDGISLALAQTGIPPHLVELELTESMLMQDVQQAAAKLHRLKALGFRIAVDDFGTGFSSLNYLRHFPIDVLKIDQSFVRELLEDQAALAIIDSIIALAGALGMNTVAEGVETQGQRELLQRHGCRTIQGYLIAKPMPAAAFVDWLASYQANADPA